MTLAFVDRPPTPAEIEKIRLLLSTYQDGNGMLAAKNGLTLPGWRDFERSVALALGGRAGENKRLFDVILTRSEGPPLPQYGLSCKMRSELNRIARDGRVTIEVSNSAGKFWDHLATRRINQANYKENAEAVGLALMELLDIWHQAESSVSGGSIDLTKSFYLVLSWSRDEWYQLHQFSLDVVDPRVLEWSFPIRKGGTKTGVGRRLTGGDGDGVLVEWYGESGGQLKFYPPAKDALWQSERFRLEPLPAHALDVLGKVSAYFPEKWAGANEAG